VDQRRVGVPLGQGIKVEILGMVALKAERGDQTVGGLGGTDGRKIGVITFLSRAWAI
jgi:hypothetical protein